MRITQWGEYGLHFALLIAELEKAGRPTVHAPELAESLKIQLEYAQQILQRLRKGGIITSVRGPHGGYKLSRSAAEINLRDVLIAAEGETFEIICDTKPLDKNWCRASGGCSLGHVWHELKTHVDSFLTDRTLDKLLSEGSMRPPAAIIPMPLAKEFKGEI
ncbi:Rrf2 family transcriptional regulator [bacterium]|nr:Rrf2 family transcriptional regulator [bacterium]